MATSVGEYGDDYHAHKPTFAVKGTQQQTQTQPSLQRSTTSRDHQYDANHDFNRAATDAEGKQEAATTYDPDDHGFRRIIRDFSPSYASLCPYFFQSGLTRSSRDQMVHDHHVDRRHFYHAAPAPIPRPLAQYSLLHFFCNKPCPLSPLHIHLRLALHLVSADVSHCNASPATEPVCCHVSYGICNCNQYDGPSVHASLGPRLGDLRVGAVVDR